MNKGEFRVKTTLGTSVSSSRTGQWRLRGQARIAAVAALALVGVGFAAPAMAVGETLAVTLTQLDGEEAWNWQDDSDTNGIVRTR